GRAGAAAAFARAQTCRSILARSSDTVSLREFLTFIPSCYVELDHTRLSRWQSLTARSSFGVATVRRFWSGAQWEFEAAPFRSKNPRFGAPWPPLGGNVVTWARSSKR